MPFSKPKLSLVSLTCLLFSLWLIYGAQASKPGIQSLIQDSLKLDLNDTQKLRIKGVLQSRLPKTQALQKKAISLMHIYLKAATEASQTKAGLQTKNKDAENAYVNLRNYQLGTWFYIKSALTEAQLAKLAEKQKQALATATINSAQTVHK